MKLFGIAPALLNEAEFTVKFWQEDNAKSTRFACSLQKRRDIDEIWLVIQYLATAAVACTWFVLEFRVFCMHFQHIPKPMLLQNDGHPFEYSSMLVTIRKVEILW
jgi:hypothetical protein